MRKVLVGDLQPGYLVDLAHDPYADPEISPEFEYEFCVVESIENEGPSVQRPEVACIVVHFENAASVGFPADHAVNVARGE